MRIQQLAVATALAVAALHVSAQPRMEPATSPFTYEVLGATPSLSVGRARVANAPDTGRAAPKAAAAAASAKAAASSAFTYDALEATPHVQVRKRGAAEADAPAAAR